MGKLTFEKKLSLDGVAIIVAAVAILMWLGGFKRQVETLQVTTDEHTKQLESVKENVTSVKNDVAVLSAVVMERTGKPVK